MEKVKVLATIGPNSDSKEIIEKLRDRGADYFRINLSHTEEEDIESKILKIKDFEIPIILDTEGSQIRSGNTDEITFEEGSIVRIHKDRVQCSSKDIFLRPLEVTEKLREGDLLAIDFDSLMFRVVSTKEINREGYITCRTLIGGKIGGKKAAHVDSPTFKLPAFSRKDLKAVELAKKYGIRTFTLSFMGSKYDVEEFRKIYPEARIYSKIESKDGLDNFLDIARVSDGVLIDRGDLSTQVPLEKIPFIQKYIIEKVREMGKEVFVATNTLEQMSISLKPNRAEVNDIINTILDGATGIALTKETAVGKYPVETLNVLKNLIKQVELIGAKDKDDLIRRIAETDYLSSENEKGLLVEPHGGRLVNRFKPDYLGDKELPSKRIEIDEETLMDVEQIGIGAFSPLEGFMKKEDFESVLDNMKLSDGTVWPLPVVLMMDAQKVSEFVPGEDIALVYEGDKETYGILHLEEVYEINKESSVQKIFGTESLEHPGVRKLLEKGNFLLGGKITLIKRRGSPYKVYELTPEQTRRIFRERGWSKVIGFHTRNVIHKSHEFIQLEGMKRALCDGLFVHPIIGKKKSGDFEADVIIGAYENMIEHFYPNSKVLLCSFASYSRYCGPREAIFTALVRKNFGCSHFIVGRDHTGVKDFYHPKASHDIFDRFSEQELGVIPVKFDNVFYSDVEKRYVHDTPLIEHPEEQKFHISGTEAREMLQRGEMPPEWFMRPEISKIIIDRVKNGERVFVD
tara:strand:+ start:2968 stop:5193 length:2226 start_codon:yes stop_codon:yes gene_type:complete